MKIKNVCGSCLILAMATLLDGCDRYSEFTITEKPFVDRTSVELYVGEHAGDRNRIQLTSSPSDRQYKWTTLVPEVATVDQNGLVTAHGEGFTVITIASENDYTEVNVRVREFVPLTGFTLDRSFFSGLVQDMTLLLVKPEPDNASEVNIQFVSSNENVVKVYGNGLVRIVGVGESTVTASAEGITQTVTVLSKMKHPRSGWTVPGYISGVNAGTVGYSSQHGAYVIMNLFDGNATTFWHANFNAPVSNYPHWFIVDMRQDLVITDVMLQRRQGYVSVNGFYLYTCPDVPVDQSDPVNGYPWELQGEYAFNSGIDAEQTFPILNHPRVRYIKMYFDTRHKASNAPNNYAQLAEFAVYGY